MQKIILAVAAAISFSSPSMAAITLDGVLDAEYGASKSSVGFDENAPMGNFGAPGLTNNGAAYDIYLTSDANAVFGYLQADRVTGLQFANLYWDIDGIPGSDIGFEVGNQRAFVPGVSGFSGEPLAGVDFVKSLDGMGFEFSIANSLFTSHIDPFAPYTTAKLGDSIVLRLSQSFGYSVAGGADYGDDRLGRVTLGGAGPETAGAVPEPATWAMMLVGFGLIGGAMRRRQRQTVRYNFA